MLFVSLSKQMFLIIALPLSQVCECVSESKNEERGREEGEREIRISSLYDT
jgi:hypothetical protein